MINGASDTEVSVNWITLQFTGELKDLEPEFRKTYFRWSLKHVRWAHLAAVLMYCGGNLADAVLLPDPSVGVPGIRLLVVSLVFALAGALSFTRTYVRFWQPMVGLLIVTASLGFLASIPDVPPEAGQMYLFAIIICLMFGHTFTRARFITSTIAGTLVLLGYIIIVLSQHGFRNTPVVHANIVYLLLVHLLGMMVSRSLEMANRRHFLLGYRLEQQAAQVADINRTLESQVSERTAELARANADLRMEMEQRLSSQREKEQLADQLQHAQKMQAIGLLAGGVAHDFNNILTAIVGNAQEALKITAQADPRWHQIQDIVVASDRATRLTQQLLTFARKQVARPRVINLSAVVENTTRMLRRIIGAHVELRTRSDDALWPVFADPGQMEQILVNLSVNARDAMPDGGSLTIETENAPLNEEQVFQRAGLEPGDYVSIRVIDTGSGIDPESKTRIFEPFFTTKKRGKGTGLGLSTVFGIVQQSHGYVEVHSAKGAGTIFTIFLPRCDRPLDATDSGLDWTEQGTATGETILIIEDDILVRGVLVQLLEGAGYHVLVADSSSQALRSAQKLETPPALVLSDVVLPGMNGIDCVEELKTLWPDIKIVLMSGHLDSGFMQRVEQEGYPLITKPFRSQAVLKTIHDTLKIR